MFVDLLIFHGQCIFVDVMINDVGIQYVLSTNMHVTCRTHYKVILRKST